MAVTTPDEPTYHGLPAAEKRAQKEEMVQWMLVWLENPAIFPQWVKLRRAAAPAPRPAQG